MQFKLCFVVWLHSLCDELKVYKMSSLHCNSLNCHARFKCSSVGAQHVECVQHDFYITPIHNLYFH